MRNSKWVFPFLLVFFEMATYLSSDMYLPALPTVMRDFSVSHSEIQWTISIWFIGAVSVQLILGPISDRFGRKSVLCFGGIVFCLSTLVCAIAPNFHIFLIARFVQGTGICFMAVPGYASIHELFEQKEAIKLLALMGSIAVLGPAFGPLLGSTILIMLNWRWIFGFLVIWSLISIVLLIIWMPESLSPDKRHPLNLSMIMRNYWRILRNFRFIVLVTIYGLLFCGFITWIAAGPFLVIDQFKQAPMMFGIYQTLIFASFIFGNNWVKRLINRVSVNKLIRLGLSICLAVSCVSLFMAILFPELMLGIIITYIIYAFGSGFAFAPLNRLAIEASTEPMGSRMAVFSTLMSCFATLGSLLVGWFYHGTLLSIALIIFIVMVLAFVLNSVLDYV